MNVKEKDRKFFGRGSEAMELEMLRAKGSIIYDTAEKKYIDFLGGAGVGNLGWGHEDIELAIRNGDRPSYVYPHFYYKPWTDLAELLNAVTPKHLSRSFRTTGGSESVDAALQIASMYTRRKKFLSVEGSYHGNTYGALSVAKSANGKKFPNLLPFCDKIDTPLNDNSLKKIEKLLGTNEYAAFIMEPVICNLGVIIPPEEFMQRLDTMCKEHGTLLIMDEAITGFYRTGKFFASEHYDIKPDIMCLAKGMAAGHAGIGAVITSNEIAEAVEEKIGLYSSFGWHPISVDAALATIHFLINNTEDLLENISKISSLFKQEIEKISFRNKPEIRIKGLAIGVDLGDENYASKVKETCLKNGLLIDTEGPSLLFLPALNIDRATVTEGLEILKASIASI